MNRLQDFPQAKSITCILPDEGQDLELLKALRAEKGVITATTFHCRGFGLQLRRRYKGRHQTAAYSVRVVNIVVSAENADDLFEYIYYKVSFNRPCPGLIYQGRLLAATPYVLPGEIQEGDCDPAP